MGGERRTDRRGLIVSRRAFLGGSALGAASLWLPAATMHALAAEAGNTGTGSLGAAGPNTTFLIDPTLIHVYPGDLHGPLQEQYLYQDSGSSTAIEDPPGGTAPAFLTKRWADYTSWYSYRITIDSSTPPPLYLTMITKGQVKLTVGGTVLLNTGPTGQGDYTAREFVLSDPSIWAAGYVEAKFEDAVPTAGWGPNLYSLELGPTSRWAYRLAHIHWDTTRIVWSVGYQDGYASEFSGTTTDFTVGGDFSQLSPSGTIRLRWDQDNIDPTKQYYFLAGCIGRTLTGVVSGTDRVDVGDTGTDDVALPTGGERVYDVDVTSYVRRTGNVVKLSVPEPWQIQNGQLLADGGGVGLSAAGGGWTDYSFSFQATPLQTGERQGTAYAQAAWAFHAQDTGDTYVWALSSYPYTSPAAPGYLTKVLYAGGQPVAPGVQWSTLLQEAQHVHDSSNKTTYSIDLSALLGGAAVYVRFQDSFSNDGWGPSVGHVTVTADGVAIADFQPTTPGEQPYVYDLDSSSVATGGWRFADNVTYFIYRFAPPAGTSKLVMQVLMWNQYLVTATGTTPSRSADVVPLSVPVTARTTYQVVTELSGATIRTSVNGQVVDTTTDATFTTGGVGFDETGSESALFGDVKVTAPDGTVLLSDSFGDGLGQWQPPPFARYDFFALAEVSPTPVLDPDMLRLSFDGNEQAVHFTRLIMISMFWLLEMENQANTGYIDASLINGAYWNGYFVADMGPAMTELFKWGFLDRTREVLSYMPVDTGGESQGHYGQDIAAGNLVFSTMCNLMRADNLDAQTVAAYWPALSAGMACLVRYCQDNPYGLVYGTNAETSANSLGIYVNASSYAVLSNAADIADLTGHDTERDTWRQYAQGVYAGMNAHLRWASDTTWLGQPMRAGTWMYGINRDGSLPAAVLAGWASVGSQKDAYWGLWADDPDFRDVSNVTLDYHSQAFWKYWTRSGSNLGFGTSYGALSERGGWALNSFLEADRMGDARKNVEHVTFNSTDLNFAPLGPNQGNAPSNYSSYTEISPWAIIRETDPNDLGNATAVGNGPGTEDLNLVEYILFLKNARLMAGVDDALADGGNLVLIPRLPWGWTSLNVNGWPVTYRTQGDFGRTSVSYRLEVQPGQAELTAAAADAVAGVQIRLGPFAPTAVGTRVTVGGANLPFRQEVRGDASWLWVICDLSPQPLRIQASVSLPLLLAWYPFQDASLRGLSTGGGDWSVRDGRLTVQAKGNAWAMAAQTVGDGSVEADAWLGSGQKLGVVLRGDAAAQRGYAFVLDQSAGQISLIRLPSTVLASAPLTVSLRRTYRLRLAATGTSLTAYLNGVQALTASDSSYAQGRGGLLVGAASAAFSSLLLAAAPLLEDTFSGTALQGWTASGGTWTADVGTALVTASGDAWCVNQAGGGDVIYSVNVRLVTSGAAGISVRGSAGGGQSYRLVLDAGAGSVALVRDTGQQLASTPLTVTTGRIYNLRIEAEGPSLRGYVDGQLQVQATDRTYQSGRFGLFASAVTARFDDARAVAVTGP